MNWKVFKHSLRMLIKKAESAEADNTSEGVKTRVGQKPQDHGCVALPHKLKTMNPRRRIMYEIQDIKSYVLWIKERSERYGFQRSFKQGSRSYRENRNAKWHDPRVAALYIDEAGVVGFEMPRKRLVYRMVLPLEIVPIGVFMSTREKNVFEWQRFIENLSLELKKDTHLIRMKGNLGISYDDLPNYLKRKGGKTWEEFAEGYLAEFIHRFLVQVSSLGVDGKAKVCRVHDLLHDLILEKFEDLNFCKHISEEGQSSLRHAKVADVPKSIVMLQNLETLEVRNTNVIELPKDAGKHRKASTSSAMAVQILRRDLEIYVKVLAQ
ncbi:hypothetical protein MTR_7g406780 [Medicago truncatula]|uniref:Disease resistance protein winged helix domain-containing protein n=1 Tax=Medicago truncatula TaxID=3880 RepID=A0A072TVL8_MEDTR|nr:hypothetical protein MTR_7g406780 [Medicago truncatula]